MKSLAGDTGSFRDPSGTVFEANGNICRSVTALAIDDFETVWASGFLQRIIAKHWLVDAERVSSDVQAPDNARAVLRHPRLPFISYPYEWGFETLKSAALLHLDIQLDALDHDIEGIPESRGSFL